MLIVEVFIFSVVEQGVMIIIFNCLDCFNSFNDLMYYQLVECLKQVECDDGVCCLLIIGVGCGFCVGQDLNDCNVDFSGLLLDFGMLVECFYNLLVCCLVVLLKLVICVVNGVVVGVGVILVLGCDIVLVVCLVKFVMVFSKFGLVLDCGGSWFLLWVVGCVCVMGLVLLGDSFSVEQVVQWGIIW